MTRFEKYSYNLLKKKFEGLIQPDEYKLIPLSKGKFAMVDNEDFEKLKGICWHFEGRYSENNKLGYMHRYIMNAPDDMLVDHEDGDKLNNRKSNLRVCNYSSNLGNSSIKSGSSKYKGVSKNKKSGKWEAYITKDYKRIYLGLFETEQEAGRAYNEKAKELFGEFARLNNI